VSTVAKSLGLDMSDDLKQAATKGSSNELIAHTMAARVLAQVSRGKNQ